MLTGATAAPEPVAASRPYVHYDAGRQILWAGAVLGAKPAEGLPVQGYDIGAGQWRTMPALRLPNHITWPVEDTYTVGRTHSYTMQVPESVSWPGQPMVASLTGHENLDLKIYFRTGEMIGQGEPMGPERWAAFICPPGEGCAARVRTISGLAPPYGSAFTLDRRQAEPTLESMISPGGKLNDMTLQGDVIYIAGMQGLRLMDADPSLGMHSEKRGPGYSAVTGIALAGPKVFISRLGFHGLVVFDASDPATPVELGKTMTLGASWDVAIYGNRAYVAHGILGLGIYDVGDPQHPVWMDQIWPGGRIETVSIARGLLAAGRSNGKVYIYDIEGISPELKETVDAGWKLDKVEFREGKLWVLKNNGKRAAIFGKNEQGEWEKVGEVTDKAKKYFFARTRGARGYTIGKRTLEAYLFEPVE